MVAYEFPHMRDAVISALMSLSRPEYQQSQWGKYDPEVPFYEDLNIVVHTLYDDCEVLPSPSKAVGSIIAKEEVIPLREVDLALGPLLDELGDRPDAEYVADPRWPNVVRAASNALAAMRRSDEAGAGFS